MIVGTNKIKCQGCGKEHTKTESNCCWISCTCGKTICGMCGYADEEWEDCSTGSDEDGYWCTRECPDCGLQGCAMCI